MLKVCESGAFQTLLETASAASAAVKMNSVNDSIDPSLAQDGIDPVPAVEESSSEAGTKTSASLASERASRLLGSNRLWSVLTVFSVIAAIGMLVRLPYYKLSPGTVYPTVERISAPADVSFEPEGDIDFLTVNQRESINVWEWIDAKLDDSIDLEHEDKIRAGRSSEEKREFDQRRMQMSKDTAVVVALSRVGYKLEVTPLGVEVAAVIDCTAADGVLNTGDVLRSVDGVEILEAKELVEELKTKKVGDSVEFLVDRIDPNNSAVTSHSESVEITLGSADDECLIDQYRDTKARPFLGIAPYTMVDEQLPIDVSIDSGRVGGPSAGLAFSLALIDVLSEGELTGGVKVAATGTIDRSGNIGPVGGIKQKTIAAQRSGVELMLVPNCCENWADPVTGAALDLPTNYEEAIAHNEGSDMKIVAVSTLDEALAAIEAAGGNAKEFMSSPDK